MAGRFAPRIVTAVLCAGCAVQLDGPAPGAPRPYHGVPPVVVVRQPPPPPVVVIQQPPPPPPPAGHVPPGQIRAAEVHQRNAERKAAHDADKAARHRGRGDRDDDDDDDDDGDHGARGHGRGHQ
jgi:hypothetical protein